jgi:hypothetical protein
MEIRSLSAALESERIGPSVGIRLVFEAEEPPGLTSGQEDGHSQI